MADYVLIRKSRNVISSILHVLLNVLLGVGSVAITVLTGSWVIGLVLVILSKWRVLAVRPRYWVVNLLSNLTDFIVGASFVFIAYCSGTVWLPIHFVLAIGYVIWLVFLKPRSTEFAAELQALFSVFLGTTATVMLFASSNAVFMTILCFLIGFSGMRHILVQSDENEFGFLTLGTGLIAAEIAWLSNSWLIVYTFGTTGIMVPQLSVILTTLIFVSSRIFKSGVQHEGKINFSEIAVPIIFSVLVVAVLVIWFSNPIFDI